jgi:SAM-dependent methyltransferase
MSEPPQDLKARVAAGYNAIANTYFTTFVSNDTKDFRLHHLTHVLSLLKETHAAHQSSASPSTSDVVQVLELGCGAGLPVTKVLLEHIAPQLTVTANDLSPTQIGLARTNLSSYLTSPSPDEPLRLNLTPGDMTQLTFPPSTFSLILAFYSLIHLPRTEQTTLMQRIATWLKPGGLTLINFAAEEDEHVVNEAWLGEKGAWMYWSSWGEEGSVRMVEESGLEVLSRQISEDEGVDSRFVWVVARKKEV